MARNTLLDFFADVGELEGTFVVHDNGYRPRRFTYREVAGIARGFALRLRARGAKGTCRIAIPRVCESGQ
jgi:hypothetical protein